MTRPQLITVYAAIIFLMVWGFDLINAVKYNEAYTFKDFIDPLCFSQLIYCTLTFIVVNILFKKYYKGRSGRLVIALLLSIIFFISIRYLIEQVIYPALFNIRNYPSRTTSVYYILDNIYYASLYVGFGVLVSLLDSQIGNQKKQALLVQQSREAELQFLRSQINPHFLFNTLNNIYSLVYEKSDKAPGATLKLSEMLRYMLYEKREFIPIAKEWEYIHSFIELEKLRFDYPLNIEILVNGNADKKEIPPYLLIPFIENAFKHGDLKDPAFPLRIQLSVKEKEIFFRVENKISYKNKDQTGGVGLNNIKRRLELVYPGRHSLQTESDQVVFSSTLVLKA
jgi:two-component system LytT family sensor kinase